MTSMKQRHVVTSFLMRKEQLLLLQRSNKVGSYQELWAGVSGGMEDADKGNSYMRAITEIKEECNLRVSDIASMRSGAVLAIRASDTQTEWIVSPYLCNLVDDAEIQLDWEHTQYRWIAPSEVTQFRTVPRLLETFRRVYFPEAFEKGLKVLKDDRSMGANQMLRYSLDMLTIAAAQCSFDEHSEGQLWNFREYESFNAWMSGLVLQIAQTRPSMSTNLVNHASKVLARVQTESVPLEKLGAQVAKWLAQEKLDTGDIANHISAALANKQPVIFTNSYSSTLAHALLRLSSNVPIWVAESRPLCEGAKLANHLQQHFASVTLVTDAAAFFHIHRNGITHILFGADRLVPNGAINKIGSGQLAAAIQSLNPKPLVWIVAQTDKIEVEDIEAEEEMDASELGHPDVQTVRNVCFEKVEPIDGYITEQGFFTDLSHMFDDVRQTRSVLHLPLTA